MGTPGSIPRSEPSTWRLLGGVLGGFGLGVVVFLGILLLFALGGGSYHHYLYPHDYQVTFVTTTTSGRPG